MGLVRGQYFSPAQFYHTSIKRKNVRYTPYFLTSPFTQLACFSDGTKLFFCRRFAISFTNVRSLELTRGLSVAMLSNIVLSFWTCWRRAASSAGGSILRASGAFEACHCS